jgi:uncharacterized repeat protein (TIGR01451 family)
MEMKSTTKLLATAGVTGVVLAGAFTGTAAAWHPKGVITKYVQNQTTNGQMSDANTTATAVSAKPGDTLKYTIIVENKGAAASNGYNDMHYTKMTDTLPAGVELVSDPTKRTINEDLGVIKPGQKVTKEYIVKVTSQKDADVIENKACFTGDSEVKDQPQKGCDPAIIKVTVPPKPEEPKKEEPKKEEPKKEILSAATTLPETGAGSLVAPVGIAAGLGYAANVVRLKIRARRNG